MTELLNQDRRRLIAVVTEHPFQQPHPEAPEPHWALDAETGRRVAYWVLEDEPEHAAPPGR